MPEFDRITFVSSLSIDELVALGCRNAADISELITATDKNGGPLTVDQVEALGFDSTLRGLPRNR